jgi:hypothetical protein
MTTLFDLTYQVARKLNQTIESFFTAELVDTFVLQTNYPNDWFNLGTLWLLYDAGGTGAAPQGESRRVSDFVSSTGALTVATAFSAATAASDRYALATSRYPREQMVAGVNAALANIRVRTEDTTTIDTAGNQSEYTLPTTLGQEDIEVWIQTEDDSDDNQWLPLHDWYIEETGTGTAQKLVFTSQPDYEYDVKIVYWLPHPPLYSDDDEMRASVPIERVVCAAALRCAEWLRDTKNVVDASHLALIQQLAGETAMYRRPRRTPRPKLSTFGYVGYDSQRDL